jgi:diguanylate cyclase (GGDEF)-like protein
MKTMERNSIRLHVALWAIAVAAPTGITVILILAELAAASAREAAAWRLAPSVLLAVLASTWSAVRLAGALRNLIASAVEREVARRTATAPLAITRRGDVEPLERRGRDALEMIAGGSGTDQVMADLLQTLEQQPQGMQPLAWLLHHDALTALPNRSLFEDRLRQAVARSQRSGCVVGLCYVDLDNFKEVNNALGHQGGDQLLKGVVSRWLTCIRNVDTLARLNGDEFAVILPEVTDEQQILPIARRLSEALKQPVNVDGQDIYVTTSIGIAVCPRDASGMDDLRRSAEAALHSAKKAGRGHCQYFTPELNAASARRLETEAELRHALEHRAFRLVYQPIVDRERQVIGAEALLRLEGRNRLAIAPSAFIPIAEETGLILPVGAWVLREACRQAHRWDEMGLPPLRLAVNVSPLQFLQHDFADLVFRTLEEEQLVADRLCIEITESLIMRNTDDAMRKLRKVRDRGVRVAVDDFGTGYSSLAYLQRLPVDTLKIDRSFVSELDAPDAPGADGTVLASGAMIVTAITDLAHNLGMRVIGEGIETEQQARFLTEAGCDAMQGYLFGRPLAPKEFTGMMAVHAQAA